MVACVVARRTWYLSDATRELSARFGDEWLHPDARGRRTIDRRVRVRFRTEHGGSVSWDPLTRSWTVERPPPPRRGA